MVFFWFFLVSIGLIWFFLAFFGLRNQVLVFFGFFWFALDKGIQAIVCLIRTDKSWVRREDYYQIPPKYRMHSVTLSPRNRLLAMRFMAKPNSSSLSPSL